MADEHQSQVPIAIEQVVSGLSELETVLGAPAKEVLPVVRMRLIEAMAARDKGDTATVIACIADAMDRLAGLADHLDPQEAVRMRAVTERFRTALLRGDQADAKQKMGVMFERSGAVERKKRDG